MVAAGVGQGSRLRGRGPGSVEEALAALELTLEVGGGTVNDVNSRNETPLHGAMYRGGSIALIDFLVERGASLEGVVNSRGWTPLRIADGVALDGVAFIRYPEAAAHLRELHARARFADSAGAIRRAERRDSPERRDGPGLERPAGRGSPAQNVGRSRMNCETTHFSPRVGGRPACSVRRSGSPFS